MAESQDRPAFALALTVQKTWGIRGRPYFAFSKDSHQGNGNGSGSEKGKHFL